MSAVPPLHVGVPTDWWQGPGDNYPFSLTLQIRAGHRGTPTSQAGGTGRGPWVSCSQGSCWSTFPVPQPAVHSTKEQGSPGCMMGIKVVLWAACSQGAELQRAEDHSVRASSLWGEAGVGRRTKGRCAPGCEGRGEKVLLRRREREESSSCRACLPLGLRRQRSDAKATVVFGEVLFLLHIQRGTRGFPCFLQVPLVPCQAGRAVTPSQSSCCGGVSCPGQPQPCPEGRAQPQGALHACQIRSAFMPRPLPDAPGGEQGR